MQDSGQVKADAGWRLFDGTPPIVPWSAGQPDDEDGGVEDGDEQIALADVGTGTFRDGTGVGVFLHAAICECDGSGIDPSVTIPPEPL